LERRSDSSEARICQRSHSSRASRRVLRSLNCCNRDSCGERGIGGPRPKCTLIPSRDTNLKMVHLSFSLRPVPVSLLVLQAPEYLDLLHLRYEVSSLILGLNLGDLRLHRVTKQAFLFSLESRLLAALSLGVFSQLASFPQLPPGGVELRVFLPAGSRLKALRRNRVTLVRGVT